MQWITQGSSVEPQDIVRAEELPDKFSFKINDLQAKWEVIHAEQLPRPCAEQLPRPAGHLALSL